MLVIFVCCCCTLNAGLPSNPISTCVSWLRPFGPKQLSSCVWCLAAFGEVLTQMYRLTALFMAISSPCNVQDQQHESLEGHPAFLTYSLTSAQP
jgi:hypothetical protein